ncbi:MAG TPA: LysR substrate-binding domain-containing protein [Gammaproteobacteria bacterium]|nr:LysR substrate-binding domain-containing protein [Gammaproteobacteria bacterium]
MGLTLRQLRYFLAVIDEGSFSGAARRVHVAQPAVSIAIARLEETLGLTLLHRGDRHVRPTAEGRVLERHARALLSGADAAELEMRELRGLIRGSVALGVPSMMGSYYFPPVLMGFKQRYPALRVSLFEGGGPEIAEMIRDGKLDLGVIVAEGEPDGIESRAFLREEMVACVPPDHQLAGRERITASEFLDHDLVLFQRGYFHRAFVDRISEETGREPRIAFESNLIALNRSLVERGFGITTFLRLVVQSEPGRLVALSFDPPVHLALSLAWKRGGYLSHAQRALVDFVLEHSAAPSR